MKVVLSWLREFCPTDLPAEELADLLTSKGVKVEGIIRPWERLEGVVVARVLEVRDHPGSEKLCLARVTTGTAEREVVVGVRNMKPGDLVPLAGPGTTVPGLPEPLTARDIRGVVSDGMLCSPRELGLSPEHEGILILPEGLAPGADVKGAFDLDGAVIDIEIEPNRPDLMSVIGVAREASAATGVPLLRETPALVEADEKAEQVADLEVHDPERCPRYLARVLRGVKVGPSPVKAQARLTAAGMRPLSNVVDATNYALLEIGHPLHPFDLALLEGSGIVVRRAVEGESLVTLDGVERVLSEEDLVIADHAKGVAVAGVMGSAAAEVSASTEDVLLESAYFERRGILRTARRLRLATEASMRFERGADPEAVPRAADRAAQLITNWSGGRILAGALEVGGSPEHRRLSMRPSRASMLLGFEVSPADAADAFERLGLSVEGTDGEVTVEVPGYRVDLEREVDLVEEVARLCGYDRVGSTLPPVRRAGGLSPTYAFLRRVRVALVRAGLREVRSLSFASSADLELTGDTDAIRVANPLSAEEGFLRTRLTPGLLRALGRNLSRQVLSAALFEIGTVFRAADGSETGVEERQKVAIALTGPASLSWADEEREFDFFDAKGVVETLLADLGIGWSLGEPLDGLFHPARSAFVLIGGGRAGVVGELHPRTVERLDLVGRVAVAELEVNALMAHATSDFVYRDVPRFPPVRRDLAFVVEAAAPAGGVQAALVEAGGDLVGSCLLFDVHAGRPVPEGKKSLAFSVDFRAPGRTLTDEEADAAIARIVERLAKDFGAELRAG